MISLIMAGGKGTRMNTKQEKLLLEYKKPVIMHVVDALKNSNCFSRIIAATSSNSPETEKTLRQSGVEIISTSGKDFVSDLNFVLRQLDDSVFITSGDLPLLDDKIIKQILYEVGDLWNTNQLPIGTEHVISNRLLGLIKECSCEHCKQTTPKKGKNKILICNPSGEQHNVACNMLESVLNGKGYNVFNMSPSTPSKEVYKYITDIQPDLVLVSITLPDNLQTGRKLVKRILDDQKTSVLVGGQAINEKNVYMFKPAEVIIQDTSSVSYTHLTLPTSDLV